MFPKVSVIVPVYNAEKTLFSALTSLRQQSLREMEFILIDDGSRDKSSEICRVFAKEDRRFKVYRQQNLGVSVARNLGLDNASGDYIGFLDSDDIAKPEMFQVLQEVIVAHDADMVMGGYEKNQDGRVISVVKLPFHGSKIGDEIVDIAWAMMFWGGRKKGRRLPGLYGRTWPNLYRRRLIVDTEINFPVGITIGEDLLFNLKYLRLAKKVSFVDKALYCYNMGDASATRRINPELMEKYLTIVQYAKSLLDMRVDDELELNLNRQIMYYAINVIEEQVPLYSNKVEKYRLIKALCENEDIHSAVSKVFSNSSVFKERFEAFLFRKSLVRPLAFLFSS